MKAVPRLADLPLAEGARWVDYGAVRLAGIAVDSTYRPGVPARDAATEARIAAIAAAIGGGPLAGVHDGARYALVGAEPDRSAEGRASSRLVLAFRDASYAAFLATNGWDPRRLAGLGAGVAGADPRPPYAALAGDALLASGFLNCLGACLQVVVRDDDGAPWTYLARRRGGIFDGYWDGSIDEGLMRGHPAGDEVSPHDPRPDLARFVRRAMAEEAGLGPSAAHPVIVAAGHDTWSLQPALVGWVAADLTARAFRARFEDAPGRDEIAETRWIALEPAAVWEAVQGLKREGRVLPWVEVGLYLTLLSHLVCSGRDPRPAARLFGPAGRGWPGAGGAR